MIQGTVKWFDTKKGFGFVGTAEKDYFVYYKEIKKPGFKVLEEGERVSFEPGTSPKGPVALNVVPD